MKVYWFQRSSGFNFKKLSEDLESCGFTGTLFPWSSNGDDYFTHIANKIDIKTKIKYMVAIRPYVISPQYLSKINQAMNRISKDRVLINFVTGWIEDNEVIGGVVGDINDLSSSIERSNYMIDYIKSLNKIKNLLPDFYISSTNSFVFEAALENNVIVPYSWYKIKKFDIDPKKTMVYIAPVIRESQKEIDLLDKGNWSQDTEFFTKNQFKDFFYTLQDNNFDGILLSNNLIDSETENIFKCIQEIKRESVR